MKPAFCELATNACADARGISLVKIMRFHACAISSADMSLRVSASSSDFTIFCASSGFFKIQSVSSRYACQNYALPDEWSRYVHRMMSKPGSGIDAAVGKKIYEFLVYDSSVRKKANG
jgi:hypothetical protein